MSSVYIADNIINPVHIDKLLPLFNGKLNFMCEVPAILSRNQVHKMAQAGVRRMQPGIEQFHDGALEVLGKVNKTYHNIRFLKWAREYGINVTWNYLIRYPSEKDEWYEEAARIIPLLTHLQPPTGATPVNIYRFSPYFNDAGHYNLNLKPMNYYKYIYPVNEESMSRLAYKFEHCAPSPHETGFAETTDVIEHPRSAKPPCGNSAIAEIRAGLPANGTNNNRYTSPTGTSKVTHGLDLLTSEIQEWRRLFPFIYAKDKTKSPELIKTKDDSGTLHIKDTRPIALKPEYTYSGIEVVIYETTDSGVTLERIIQMLAKNGFDDVLSTEVEMILQDFINALLMLKTGDRYIALATGVQRNDYLPEELVPGGWYRRKQPDDTGSKKDSEPDLDVLLEIFMDI